MMEASLNRRLPEQGSSLNRTGEDLDGDLSIEAGIGYFSCQGLAPRRGRFYRQVLPDGEVLTEPTPPFRTEPNLPGWPTPLALIPVTSRTSNGPSLGPFCPPCHAGQTVEGRPWRENYPS